MTTTQINSTLCPDCLWVGGTHDVTCGLPRPLTPAEAARYANQRGKWADQPDILDELDADIRRQLSRPAPPACPNWCDEVNHDGYEDLCDSTDQVRGHTIKMGEAVFVMIEEFRSTDDVVTRGAPFIHTYLDDSNLTADQAADHGRALLRAAGKLREIGGAA